MKKLMHVSAALSCAFLLAAHAFGQAAAPVCTPAAGAYSGTQTVSCTTTTSGADIFYTTDGSTPTPESTLYTGPLTVSSTTTVKAIAAVAGVRQNNIQNNNPSSGGTYWKAVDCVNGGGSGTPTGLVHSSGIASPSLSGASMEFSMTAQSGHQTNCLWSASTAFGKCDSCTYQKYDYQLYLDTGVCTNGGTTEQDSAKVAPSLGNLRYMAGAQWRRTGGCTSGHACLDIGGNSNVHWTFTGVDIPLACGTWHHMQRAEHFVPAEVTSKPCTDFNGAHWPYVYEDYWIVDGTRYNNGGAGWKFCANSVNWPSWNWVQHQEDATNGTHTMYLDQANFVSYFPASAVTTATYSITGGAPTAPAPSFSPAAGSFTTTQTVTVSDSLSSPTPVIYCTTDGTTPTTSSPVYSAPFTIAATTTLQCMATATGYLNSAVSSAVYTIGSPGAAPTFSPASGTYSTPQTITISEAVPGLAIHYTLDGTTPTVGSPLYTGPFTISVTTTVKAVAIGGTGSTPVIRGSGVLSSTGASSLSIPLPAGTAAGDLAVLYTSGAFVTSTPAGWSSRFLDNTGGNNLFAQAATKVLTSGDIATGTVTVTQANSVAFFAAAITTFVGNPPVRETEHHWGGAGATSVTNNTTSAVVPTDLAIYYAACRATSPALPSITPASGSSTSLRTDSDAQYSARLANQAMPGGALAVTSAVAAGCFADLLGGQVIVEGGGTYSSSPVGTATYIITSTTPAPTFAPPPGNYSGTVAVTISDSAPSSTIYYTLDGSTPTTSSTVYTTPLSITTTTTINAIAVSSGYGTSSVATGLYTIGCALPPLGTGSIDPSQIKPGSRQGPGLLFQMTSGGYTLNDLPAYDCSGNLVDSGTLISSLTGGATKQAVQQESYVYATDTGSANAYAIALSPAPTLVAGSTESFIVAHTNTGASTLATNGGSAIAVKKGAGATALAAGDWPAGQLVTVKYDGTNWQWGGGSSSGSTGTVTSVALTMPSRQSVSGSPVTTSGTFAVTDNNQNANLFFAGPSSGAAATPTFRAIAASDMPAMVGDTGLGGTKGAVPAPGAGDAAAGKFLKADGSFAVPSGSSVYYGQGDAVAAAGNNTVTLGSTPISGSSVSLFDNGKIVQPSTYSISGAAITLPSGLSSGDIVVANWVTSNATPGSITLSSTGAPTLRGTNLAFGTGSSITIALPSGSVAGDTAILMASSGWSVNTPSGWTATNTTYATASWWSGAVFSKVLSSGDITAGNVTVSFTGSFDANVAIAVIAGSTYSVLNTAASQNGSPGGTSVGITTGFSASSSNLMLYFGTNRANSTDTVSSGTMKQQGTNSGNASACLYAESGVSGTLTRNFLYSTGGNGNFQVIIRIG